jgi:hypothetical protein
LLWIIDEAIDELTAREAYLRNGPEVVERKYAADQAVLNLEEKSSGLWLRYYKEINSEYFPATKKLRRSLAEDEGSSALEVSPNEPNSGCEQVSPTEPNATAEISPSEPNASEITVPNDDCEGSSVKTSEPGRGGQTRHFRLPPDTWTEPLRGLLAQPPDFLERPGRNQSHARRYWTGCSIGCPRTLAARRGQ